MELMTLNFELAALPLFNTHYLYAKEYGTADRLDYVDTCIKNDGSTEMEIGIYAMQEFVNKLDADFGAFGFILRRTR